jgi:hypothetical protein
MPQVEISFTVHTRLARCVMWLLKPAVLIGALSPDRAGEIAERFIRITTD